jgi:CheY-like chemotaxis protein
MPRIAVVDDDPRALELAAEIVQGRGWDVLPVHGSPTVGEVVGRAKPDAVIFDFHTGVMGTAWELLERLTDDPATCSIPLMIWSADFRSFEGKQEWFDAHHIPVLSKPFELEDLYAQLDRLLVQPTVRMSVST